MVARANGTIALSASVFGEIVEVLGRPKFARAIREDRRREVLEVLSSAALWIEPVNKIDECRDTKDNRYLELAVAACATVIVSGDQDLLVLHPWRGIQVLQPAAFVVEFGSC